MKVKATKKVTRKAVKKVVKKVTKKEKVDQNKRLKDRVDEVYKTKNGFALVLTMKGDRLTVTGTRRAMSDRVIMTGVAEALGYDSTEQLAIVMLSGVGVINK